MKCSYVYAALLLLAPSFALAQHMPAHSDQALPNAKADVDAARFPSIQAAIDSLEGAGVVRLPAGSFEISQPIIIRHSDVTLEGAGGGTVIVNKNEQGKPAILIRSKLHTGKNNDRKHELWRVRIADLRILGNPSSGHGIHAHNVNEAFIQGVTISRNGGDGVLLQSCFEDARVNDSVITYNKQSGLNATVCHDVVVSGNHFEENQDAVRFTDGFNLTMSGNNVDDHLRHGVVIENTYGSVVSGNMLEECQGTAVILDRDCYGITVSANVIAHNDRGVDLRDAHGCALSANTFTIMLREALLIGAKSGRITVTGNNFSNSYIGGGKVKRPPSQRAAGGVKISGKAVAVVGNVFSGLTSTALAMPGPESESIEQSNVFTDNAKQE